MSRSNSTDAPAAPQKAEAAEHSFLYYIIVREEDDLTDPVGKFFIVCHSIPLLLW